MRRTLVTMAKNPLLISVLAGLAFAASGLALPAAVDTVLGMLAASAAPVALFALGATVFGQPLTRPPLPSNGQPGVRKRLYIPR